MPSRTSGALLLSLALFIPAALAGQPAKPQESAVVKRVVASGEWQVIRDIGLDNDLIDDPGPVSVRDDRIVLFDYGTMSVKSFRLDGTLEWSAGRRGRGPGEYASALAIALDSTGRAFVLDADLSRVTVITRGGKLEKVVPFKQRFERVAVGAGPAHFLLIGASSDTLSSRVDLSGSQRRVASLPADLRSAPSISRELASVVSTARGHTIAFRWSSRMLILDRDGKVGRSCVAVDSLSMPDRRRNNMTVNGMKVEVSRVEPRAREAAASVTTLGSSMAVLRPAWSAKEPAVLDIYGADCGRYIESRPFNYPAARALGTENTLVVLMAEPVPHLKLLRWVPSPR